jgi:hypothetical protein
MYGQPPPREFEYVFFQLLERAKAGHTLAIHVAKIGSEFLVFDGHVCLEVYEHLGAKEVTIILHDEIKDRTELLAAYVASNHLRSSEWLRSGVTLQQSLSTLKEKLGEDAVLRLVEDPNLARDLIRRDEARWWEFSNEVLDAGFEANGYLYQHGSPSKIRELAKYRELAKQSELTKQQPLMLEDE